MKNLIYCRRTFVSTLAVLCITALGVVNQLDVSYALAGVAAALASANAFEGSKKHDAKIREGV